MGLTIDTIRAIFTYLIALVIVIGGGLILWSTYSDPSADNLALIVGGFIGSAVTWVFTSETATRSARQSASAHNQGAILHANGFTNAAPSPSLPQPPT